MKIKSRTISFIFAGILFTQIILPSYPVFADQNPEDSSLITDEKNVEPEKILKENISPINAGSSLKNRELAGKYESDPPEKPAPKIHISAISTTNNQKFIELFNQTNYDISTENLSLEYYGSGATKREIILKKGVFKANSYLLIAQNSFLDGFDFELNFEPASSALIGKSSGALILQNQESGFGDEICWGTKSSGYVCNEDERFAKSGLPEEKTLQKCLEECAEKYVSVGNYFPKYSGFIAQIIPPSDEDEPGILPNKNLCSNMKLSEIAANYSEQFIEVYNYGANSENLNGCKIKTNRNNKTHNFGDFEIKSGAYFAVKIDETDLTLTKSTKGKVYFLNEENEEIDSVSYDNLKSETSFSRFGEGFDWRQTFSITPNLANNFMQFLPCEESYERNAETGKCRKMTVEETELGPCKDGYYRNLETGRCRKIEVPAEIIPCKAGYERSPETGRCRKIVVEAGLTPCKVGYERNPETGRCRKIETEKELVPCKAGYERNPETGRCRKIVKNTGASDSIKDEAPANSEFTGWLAIAGIAFAGIGIVTWEFRAEIAKLFKKFRKNDKIKK